MCLACNDADKKAEIIRKDPNCIGEITPIMTIKQVKDYCIEEWLKEGKTRFRIFKAGVIDPLIDQFSWKEKNAEISVQLV